MNANLFACQSVLLLVCACFALGFSAFASCREASIEVSVAIGACQENDGEQEYIGWGG